MPSGGVTDDTPLQIVLEGEGPQMSPEDLRPAKQARGEQQTDTGAMSSGGAGHATKAVHFADFADEVDPDDGAEMDEGTD